MKLEQLSLNLRQGGHPELAGLTLLECLIKPSANSPDNLNRRPPLDNGKPAASLQEDGPEFLELPGNALAQAVLLEPGSEACNLTLQGLVLGVELLLVQLDVPQGEDVLAHGPQLAQQQRHLLVVPAQLPPRPLVLVIELSVRLFQLAVCLLLALDVRTELLGCRVCILQVGVLLGLLFVQGLPPQLLFVEGSFVS